MAAALQSGEFRCYVCKKTFSANKSLRHHVAKFHPVQAMDFMPPCLRRGRKPAGGNACCPEVCVLCSKTFYSATASRLHRQLIHRLGTARQDRVPKQDALVMEFEQFEGYY